MDPAGTERRLAAILIADVVGYSRLMAEDDAGTIQTLTAYRSLITSLVGDHHGRVVDSPGDNLLAEFPNALDAVQCAVEIQGVLRVRNQSLAENRRMLFRIGVHLGDITAEGDRVYGDGVNIAARLEGLAQSGGICISSSVRDQIRQRLDVALEDLGDQDVKNIAEPVRVFRVAMPGEAASELPPSSRRVPRSAAAVAVVLVLVAAAVAFWSVYDPAELRPVPRTAQPLPGFRGAPAIAVLPFDNLSGDPDQEYFADGITEDLITRLSYTQWLPVVARNSTFVYKGKAADVKQVGQELGARYIIEGSVRRSDDTVRITAQLNDATTGRHLWAKQYDRDFRDLFALQDEIVDEILKAIDPSLKRAERERAMRKDPQSLDAWDLVQRGLAHARKFTKGDNRQARDYYQQAVALDPLWAEAHAFVAWTHMVDIGAAWTDSRDDSLAELRAWSERAVEADRQNSFAQLMSGRAHQLSSEWDQAIQAYESAIRLNPSNANARQYLGQALTSAGRSQEAIPVLEDALRLSARRDMSDLLTALARAHFASREYEAGVARGREAIPWAREKSVGFAVVNYLTLAANYSELGRDDEAQAAVQKVLLVVPELSLAGVRLGLSYTDPDLAERAVDALRKAGLPE